MIKEVEAGIGSVDQGKTSVLRSKYKSAKNVEWDLNCPSAEIVASTKRTCTVESENVGSVAFKLNGHSFTHRRNVIPTRGRTDINKVKPVIAPQESEFKLKEQPALQEVNKTKENVWLR